MSKTNLLCGGNTKTPSLGRCAFARRRQPRTQRCDTLMMMMTMMMMLMMEYYYVMLHVSIAQIWRCCEYYYYYYYCCCRRLRRRRRYLSLAPIFLIKQYTRSSTSTSLMAFASVFKHASKPPKEIYVAVFSLASASSFGSVFL